MVTQVTGISSQFLQINLIARHVVVFRKLRLLLFFLLIDFLYCLLQMFPFFFDGFFLFFHPFLLTIFQLYDFKFQFIVHELKLEIVSFVKVLNYLIFCLNFFLKSSHFRISSMQFRVKIFIFGFKMIYLWVKISDCFLVFICCNVVILFKLYKSFFKNNISRSPILWSWQSKLSEDLKLWQSSIFSGLTFLPYCRKRKACD